MVSLGPKKDGGPNKEFFESPESMQGFEAIRQWLTKHYKKYIQTDPPTKDYLSKLIIEFIEYQEKKFDKNASEHLLTRLPMRCFLDFRPGGSLCHIFANMYRYKAKQRWRKFDFTISKNPMRKDPNVQMLMEIETALIEADCFRMPLVYVRPDVDKALASKVKSIITEHQGEITEDEEEASHIVCPIVEPLPEDFARPTFRRGNHIMIHWYYLPESYDSWVPNTFDLPDIIPENPASPENRWRVSASWVLDLNQYNEWMAEEDYEVDEKGGKKVHKLRLFVEELMPIGPDDKRKPVAGTSKQKWKRARIHHPEYKFEHQGQYLPATALIDTYRLNPTEYLTSTACLRNLAGDVCAIMRVHAFLEQWGLINYQIDAESRPTAMGPPPTTHLDILSDTPSGLQPLNPPKTTQPSAAKALFDLDKNKKEKDPDASPSGAVPAGASATPPTVVKTEYTVESNGQFGLKLDQYSKKPSALKNKTAAGMSREWSEQETLLLLEGLEIYRDDCNKVCEHVGTRTQDECILHCLRLPIEDPYLEDDSGYLGPLAYQPVPFSKSGNPIMSTVAFLASIVDPRIAAAAAKAAMEEFTAIREEVPPGTYYAHYKNVEMLAVHGKFVPNAGLDISGIAGTGSDKEEEEAKPPMDEEMKDVSKKDGGLKATFNFSNKLPCVKVDQLADLLRFITQSESSLIDFVKYIQSFRGGEMQKSIKKILDAIMHKDVQRQLFWSGLRTDLPSFEMNYKPIVDAINQALWETFPDYSYDILAKKLQTLLGRK